MTVRAKMKVTSIERFEHGDSRVNFGAVYKDDPSAENKQFWKYTPNINFSMTLSQIAGGALAFYEECLADKTEMYVDFEKAPKEEPKA